MESQINKNIILHDIEAIAYKDPPASLKLGEQEIEVNVNSVKGWTSSGGYLNLSKLVVEDKLIKLSDNPVTTDYLSYKDPLDC